MFKTNNNNITNVVATYIKPNFENHKKENPNVIQVLSQDGNLHNCIGLLLRKIPLLIHVGI